MTDRPAAGNHRHLTLGHSPDPDDAFMFYGLAAGHVECGAWTFEHVLADIQTLNERARRGELDITALSIHAYPYVSDRYILTPCGASVGDGYGPLVVARRPMSIAELKGKIIAVPGELTTAFLVLNLLLGRGTFQHRVTMFDRIPQEVADGRVDAGLVIHEGQLTFERLKLQSIVDLGAWWKDETGLPLPLGGNGIRRDLGRANLVEIADILRHSICYGLEHRDEAVRHALRFGRGLDINLADRFVGMYVNDWTVDWGRRGREAILELFRRGVGMGLLPEIGTDDLVL